MSAGKAAYLERFMGGIDKIEYGRPGGISEDRWLAAHYEPEYAPLICRYLSYGNENVRAETVMLLTDVREPYAADVIRKMSVSDTEKVRGACIGYLNALESAEERIPALMDILKHRRGEEFFRAAETMKAFGRKEDIDELRGIMGYLKGDMRKALKEVLEHIVNRYPELGEKRYLILSDPVRPDIDSYNRFLNRSTEYIDARYRENVFPSEKISRRTETNVLAALKKMSIRIYNETDNLEFYGPSEADAARRLTELIAWAYGDLKTKEIYENEDDGVCPKCGKRMIAYKGMKSCPGCGTSGGAD
ncbi:MAG: HEAT repeat domain-containing protein [Candidatus Methanomethylophilaceae archaeon]|jgi:hypothetical protein